MATLAELQVKLDLQNAEFQKGMNSATKSMAKMQNNTKKLSGDVGKMKDGFSKAAKAAIAFAGVNFGVSAIKNVIAMNDEIAKTADALGLGVESFQELRYAAQRGGVEVSAFDSSMEAFARRMGQLRQNTGSLASGLKTYDAVLAENLKKTTTQEQALDLIADKMKSTESATERAYLANLAFGRSGVALTGMLKNGADGLQDMANEARDLGIVMEEELVRNSEAYADQLLNVEKRIQTTFGRGLLTVISTAMDESKSLFFAFFGTVEKGWNNFKAAILVIFEGIKVALTGLFTPAIESIRLLLEAASKLPDALGGGWAQDAAAALPTVTNQYNSAAIAIEKIAAETKAANEAIDENVVALIAQEQKIQAARKEASKLAAERRKEQAALDSALEESATEAVDKSQAKVDSLNAKIKTLNEQIKELEGQDKPIKQVEENAASLSDTIKGQTEGAVRDLSDTFVDFATTGKFAFEDFANSMVQNIARIIVEAQLLSAVKSAFPNLFPAAHGMALNNGQILPYAKGGVVSSPTYFPMAKGMGLMGEAGPEAIIPLSRMSNGDLGVRGGGTTVNVINNSGGEATVTETETPNGGINIDVLIEKSVEASLSRGRFDKTLGGIFGLRRRGN